MKKQESLIGKVFIVITGIIFLLFIAYLSILTAKDDPLWFIIALIFTLFGIGAFSKEEGITKDSSLIEKFEALILGIFMSLCILGWVIHPIYKLLNSNSVEDEYINCLNDYGPDYCSHHFP